MLEIQGDRMHLLDEHRGDLFACIGAGGAVGFGVAVKVVSEDRVIVLVPANQSNVSTKSSKRTSLGGGFISLCAHLTAPASVLVRRSILFGAP